MEEKHAISRSCWSWWRTFTGWVSMRDTENNMAFFCGRLECCSQLHVYSAVRPLFSLEASMLYEFSWSVSFIVSTLPCELESESRNCPLKISFILWLHETSAEAVQHLPRRASHSYSSNVLLRFLNAQDTQHYVAKHKTEWTIIVSLSYSDKVWIQGNWSITKTNWRMSQSQVNHNKFI